MAKVMVSMPDELLAQVDDEAERKGTSRSAVLRGYAEEVLQGRAERRASAMEELLRRASSRPHASPYGGDVAELVKAGRPDPLRHLRS